MANPSVQETPPKVQPMALPDTGDVKIKVGYGATIITGMCMCSGILLQDLMDYLREYHRQAFDECREQFDAMDSCHAVIRDHAETIQKISG